MRTSPSPQKTSLLFFAVVFDVQTNLNPSITVLVPKKTQRRDYFPKTQLVASQFFVCRTLAETKGKTANVRAYASEFDSWKIRRSG